jgi:CheY-like chemotaxis protein
VAAVLLVDSDEDGREMYAEYLRIQGFRVQTATTTDDAFSRASEVDVVVTGIRVGGSYEGVELVRRLRTDDATRRVPIVVLTACVSKSDQERAEAAGCNVFLRKPCLPERLADEVRSLIAARQIPRPRPAQAHFDGQDRRRTR